MEGPLPPIAERAGSATSHEGGRGGGVRGGGMRYGRSGSRKEGGGGGGRCRCMAVGVDIVLVLFYKC